MKRIREVAHNLVVGLIVAGAGICLGVGVFVVVIALVVGDTGALKECIVGR